MTRQFSVHMPTIALCLLLGGACSPAGTVPAPAPDIRSVRVETGGCGMAFDAEASGVVVGEDLVLTVAHVVLQAGRIAVDDRPAHVVALDRRSDLALLDVPGTPHPGVAVRGARPGESGFVHSVRSGPVPYTVRRVVDIAIEEALGTERALRVGYEIDAAVAVGDSGAGLFDHSGRLAGVLFAVGGDDGRAWATSATEVRAIMAGRGAPWTCDPARSRLVPPG